MDIFFWTLGILMGIAVVVAAYLTRQLIAAQQSYIDALQSHRIAQSNLIAALQSEGEARERYIDALVSKLEQQGKVETPKATQYN